MSVLIPCPINREILILWSQTDWDWGRPEHKKWSQIQVSIKQVKCPAYQVRKQIWTKRQIPQKQIMKWDIIQVPGEWQGVQKAKMSEDMSVSSCLSVKANPSGLDMSPTPPGRKSLITCVETPMFIVTFLRASASLVVYVLYGDREILLLLFNCVFL